MEENLEERIEALIIKSAQEDDEEAWLQAKELGKDGVKIENYENLLNVIIVRAVEDYEELISGDAHESVNCNKVEIRAFAELLGGKKVNLVSILDRVEHVFASDFIPYVNDNYEGIIEECKQFKKAKLDFENCNNKTKYHCPLCGHRLRVRHRKRITDIVCTNCHLSAVPETAKKKIKEKMIDYKSRRGQELVECIKERSSACASM